MAWFRSGRWNRSSLLKKVASGRKSFSGESLSGVDLSETTIASLDFAGADLRDVNFKGSQIRGCSFRAANLEGAAFHGAGFSLCDFREACLDEVGMKGATFRECSGLAGLPLELVGDSFGRCDFQERLAYVLAFLEQYPGRLNEAARAEAVPILRTMEHRGRKAVLSLPCGGSPLALTLPLGPNHIGSFELFRAKVLHRAQLPSSCGGPVLEAPEIPEELSPMVWATALPAEMVEIKRRLAALGDAKDRVFDLLGDPNTRSIRVSSEELRFELGPFFAPGTKESIELALDTGVSLAQRLEAAEPSQ